MRATRVALANTPEVLEGEKKKKWWVENGWKMGGIIDADPLN